MICALSERKWSFALRSAHNPLVSLFALLPIFDI